MTKTKIDSFKKVLIANRGEIAVRIIKTLNQLGLQSVAVYTEVDKNSPHVKLADEAIKIGEDSLVTSYLSIDRMIEVAHQTNSEAIHPGYGFLSENPEFAKQCEKENLIFIGPKHDVIAKMANKKEAKEIAKRAGVPCLPGYSIKKSDNLDVIIHAAERIGYPIMIKATAGGGGKGMRVIKKRKSLENDLNLAKSESLAAFGSSEVILERAIAHSRHIEVQVFGDQKGNLIHLGERDCSIQRRNQKIIEESPAPSISKSLRNQLYSEAIKLTKAINYTNAGTVEFLVDENEKPYFLEMNTRLQVEHAVTELVTGLDLVEMQLRIADGQQLSINQKEVSLSGHAIEVRLYAEDPRNDFLPSSGILNMWKCSDSKYIRVDSGVVEGQNISPLYDPMLAKIIACKSNRKESILELKKFLSDFSVSGIKNNRDLLIDILRQKDFLSAKLSTSFLNEVYPEGIKFKGATTKDFAVATALFYESGFNAIQEKTPLIPKKLKNWSNLDYLRKIINLEFLGKIRQIYISPLDTSYYEVNVDKQKFKVAFTNEKIVVDGSNFSFVRFSQISNQLTLIKKDSSLDFSSVESPENFVSEISDGVIQSPIHGNIVDICFKIDQRVKAGDTLAILEAMKMQHEILATENGKIKIINCTIGSQVAAGEILIKIETEK